MDEATPAPEQGLEAEETHPREEAAAAPAVEPGETPETPEAPGAKPAEKPEGVQKRIDELTRKRYEAEREAAYWRGKAEGQKPEAGQGSEEAAQAKPKQEAYQSYEEYLEALTDWKLTARLKTERTRIQEESQKQTVAQGFEAQVKSAREKHADFDALVYNESLQISETMREVILQSDDGASLAYHLGKNPEEAARIARLAPMAQIMAIGRLQATLEANAAAPAPAPAPSTAPAPIIPVKASAPGQTGLREDLSIGDWMKRRNAELYKR